MIVMIIIIIILSYFFFQYTMHRSTFPTYCFPCYYCNNVCVSLLLVSVLIFLHRSLSLPFFPLPFLWKSWVGVVSVARLRHPLPLEFFASSDMFKPVCHLPIISPPPTLSSEFQSPQPPTTVNAVAILQPP